VAALFNNYLPNLHHCRYADPSAHDAADPDAEANAYAHAEANA
jgi:hypothetical protein